MQRFVAADTQTFNKRFLEHTTKERFSKVFCLQLPHNDTFDKRMKLTEGLFKWIFLTYWYELKPTAARNEEKKNLTKNGCLALENICDLC